MKTTKTMQKILSVLEVAPRMIIEKKNPRIYKAATELVKTGNFIIEEVANSYGLKFEIIRKVKASSKADQIKSMIAKLEQLNPELSFGVRYEWDREADKMFALIMDHPTVKWSGDYCKASHIEEVLLVDGAGSIPVEVTRDQSKVEGCDFVPLTKGLDASHIDIVFSKDGSVRFSTELTDYDVIPMIKFPKQ